jgi:hypothetical protein
MKNRKFREITQTDVGRSVFQAFGRGWMTAMFLPPGQRIASVDIGKRVYLDRGTLSMETDAQFEARQKRTVEGLTAGGKLARREEAAMRTFIRAVEKLLLDFDAESVGRIADYVGEHGTDGDGGALEDAAVMECLRVLVDAKGRDKP